MKQEIKEYLRAGRKAHLMGIGGVSMEPLAEVLLRGGVAVSGSDMRESEAIERLRELGVAVSIGHRAENVRGAECIIRTAAVHDDNPEIVEAKRLGIPVFERAEAWGELMRGYENALCISGTHGKTTTTSMCTHIALAADSDPTVMIGGTLPVLGSGCRLGNGNTIVMESCEYCNSFLSFFPTVAVILNIEEDHLDFFKDLKDIQNSFLRFAQRVPQGGAVVANGEDKNTMDALAEYGGKVVTFGLKKGDVHAENLLWHKGLPEFDIVRFGAVLTHVALRVPGEHNVKNALAAAAAAAELGWNGQTIRKGLESFVGAGRRFEKLGELNGAMIYDDYAHHPEEIRALLRAVKPLEYRRVICAFQPHTYTRTKALFHEFVQALGEADLAVLTDIYPARETDDLGVSSRQLAQAIPNSLYFGSLAELEAGLRQLAQAGDLILLTGAGDVVNVGKALVRE